jgi:hypothetical protein
MSLYYLLQNPSPTTTANVTITYLRNGQSPIVRTHPVPAHSRLTIDINGTEGLGATDVSGVITSDIPIIAERSMYNTPAGQPAFAAASNSVGATAQASTWYFAESSEGGSSALFWDTYILIANPNASPATVQATFYPGGSPITQTYTIPAQQRFSVRLNDIPGLASAAPWVQLQSINGVQFVAERAMWWSGNGATWYEGTSSIGATVTSPVWVAAAPEVDLTFGSSTYLLLANPTTTAGSVNVTLMFGDGMFGSRKKTCSPETWTASGQIVKTYPIGAQSRLTINVKDVIQELMLNTDPGNPCPPVFAGTLVGAHVAGTVPLIVEHSIYSNRVPYDGLIWSAGGNAFATRY